MELTVRKDDLLNAVTIAMRGVANKTTTPILECFMLSASGDILKITATDMELGVETVTNATVKEEGSIATEAKLFSDIVRKLPDGDVKIKTDDTSLSVNCGKARFKLGLRDSAEFPALDEIDKSNVLKLTQEGLKELISQTIFSVAMAENNRMMTGELFKVSDNKLTVVALDGHRIAIRTSSVLCDDMAVVIPAKTLLELSKVLTEGDIDVYFTDSHAVFEFDQTTMSTRLIEGEYFDIDKMLLGDYTLTIKADRRTFIDALDRATLLVKEIERKPVILTIGDNLNLRIDTNIGSMNEDMDITKDGEDMKLGFNPRFLLDAFRSISDDTVTINFINPKSPCFIKGEDYTYVVLPINFNQGAV